MLKLDYTKKEKILWSFLKVTYVISFGFILVSFYFPYYKINGNEYFRYENIQIFTLYYIVLTIIAVFSNWIIFYRVNTGAATKSDYYSLIPLNLFILTERFWQPLINPEINVTPEITWGLILFHAGIFIQFIGVFFTGMKRSNDIVLGLRE